MNRQELLAMLNTHIPADEFEWAMWANTIEFVEKNPSCFERSLAIGHVTASGWVVSPDRRQVLLMHHRKLNRWFQPGGHCVGEPDVLGVEAPVWTETLTTLEELDQMLFPRIASAAEIAWSPARGAHPWRTWESFASRLGGLAPLWEAQGVGFSRRPEIAWAH